jgi:serine/threonine protein kinase/formylglycine-generating enzyme required for sulfatase activity
MKPTPDESSEIEPPMTRVMLSTDLDEEAGGSPDDPNATVEEEPRPPLSETDVGLSRSGDPMPDPPWSQGQSADLLSSWSGGSDIGRGSGPASRRGIVGRIEPGQTLYSKYEVLRKLGGGAMGDVWLVRHVALKSQHALKVIVPNFAANPLALMRFQREFEIMATLRHEHAVTIYDACIDADGGYIDMEYVEGQTIHEVLGTARGREGIDLCAPLMPLDWIVRVLDQLCEVLQVAHQKGVVHRDLKPSNMMLLGGRPPGKEYLKVLDFGIAKIRDDPEGANGRDQPSSEHKTEGYIGTPSYGSPEQALGVAELDGRADLYSVGVMLYEFVTGRLPFRGQHWQVMHMSATAPRPPFAEVNARLRPMPELERAILRALARSPDERPQTARELYEEIRQAVVATLPSGASGLPSTWGEFPVHIPHPSPVGALEPTQQDPSVGEPPATQADTLVARADVPERKLNPALERPSDLEGQAKPRWKIAALLRSKKWMLSITLTACSAMLLLVMMRPTTTTEPPTPLKGMVLVPPDADSGTVLRKKPVDFESYWPDTYRPVEGYTQGMPWPERVRRTTDEAVFHKFADRVYLPETFEPDTSAGLASDGWPKVIVKNGIRLLRMPGDTWVMGAWDDPNAVDRADAPAHPVTLNGYYIQETEVTNGQLEDYLRKVDSSFPSDWEKVFNRFKKEGPDVARRYPASNVSRDLALKFARWMLGQLPTEAQWEYAARSLGQKRYYVWGDDPAPDRTMARIDADNLAPAPVGSYPKDKTEQGVLDLTGNLQEMCRDAWVSSYIKSDAAVLDPCALANDPARAQFSVRGGYFASIGKDCATTRRDDKLPAADLGENIGFRLVVECPDPRKPR